MTRLFVTGTDTEVGKTWISTALLRLFAARGARSLGLKLVASGCQRNSAGELIAEDAELLAAASNVQTPDAVACPYRFAPPIAPGLAAEQTGTAIDFDRLFAAVAVVSADFLLIEGAGGFLCPLGQGRTFADFAVRLGAPVLVVARASLGTVNHSLLTVEAIRRRGLSVRGVLLNDLADTPADAAKDNAEQIARYGRVPVFGPVPHTSFEDLPAAVARVVSLDLLADAKPAK